MTDEFTEKFSANITLKIHFNIHFSKFTFQNLFFEIHFLKLSNFLNFAF